MSATYVNEGRISQVDALVAARTYSVRLYQNNYTPVVGSVLANFTIATYSGYASQNAAFGASSIDANGNAKADAAALTFAHSGGATSNSIYGYYVVDTGANKVVFAERFAGAPLSFAIAGDQVVLTPHMYGGPTTPPL